MKNDRYDNFELKFNLEHRLPLLFLIFGILLITNLCQSATPPQITYIPLSPPNSTSSIVTGYDGQTAVGYYFTSSTSGPLLFTYSQGKYTTLTAPNSYIHPVGVSGQLIAGNYVDASGDGIGAFFYDGATFTTIDSSNSLGMATYNNFAEEMSGLNVLCDEVNASGEIDSYIYNSGVYLALTQMREATAISGNYVVGYSNTNAGITIYDGSEYTNIGIPPTAYIAIPMGISNGNVVGLYNDINNQYYAFLYKGGNYSTLNFPIQTRLGMNLFISGNAVACSDSTYLSYYSPDGINFVQIDPYNAFHLNYDYGAYITSLNGNTVCGNYTDNTTFTRAFMATVGASGGGSTSQILLTDTNSNNGSQIQESGTAWIITNGTAAPYAAEMPGLSASVAGLNSTTGNINWTLTTKWNRKSYQTNHVFQEYETSLHAVLPSTSTWNIAAAIAASSTPFLGGDATLTATPSDHAKTPPLTFKILGSNPGEQTILNQVDYINQNNSDAFWFMPAILSVESAFTFNQFYLDGLPDDSFKYSPDPDDGTPIFGPPDGWGISQIDPTPPSHLAPAILWNWVSNINTALTKLVYTRGVAQRYFAAAQEAYGKSYTTPPNFSVTNSKYPGRNFSTNLSAIDAATIILYNGAGGIPAQTLPGSSKRWSFPYKYNSVTKTWAMMDNTPNPKQPQNPGYLQQVWDQFPNVDLSQ